MKCKNCKYQISEIQNKEFSGCCCTYCMDRTKLLHCVLCGVAIEGERRDTLYCSAGCAGEDEERVKN